jgi:hypothetical protein
MMGCAEEGGERLKARRAAAATDGEGTEGRGGTTTHRTGTGKQKEGGDVNTRVECSGHTQKRQQQPLQQTVGLKKRFN